LRRAIHRSLVLLLLGMGLGSGGPLRAGVFNLRQAALTVQARAEGGEPEHAAVFKWINFAILAGGLAYLLRKPLGEFFAQRSAGIQQSLEEGRKALEAAQVQLQAVEEKLQHFEAEMANFRAGALREMEQERERLRQATAQEAAKMLESVRAQMETAGKQASVELKLYAAELAVVLAQKVISERLDATSQQQLVSRFITGLQAGRTSN